jgi:hypothetical protein
MIGMTHALAAALHLLHARHHAHPIMPILSMAAGLSAAGGVAVLAEQSCVRTAEPAAILTTTTSAAIAASARLFMSLGCFVPIENAPSIASCFSDAIKTQSPPCAGKLVDPAVAVHRRNGKAEGLLNNPARIHVVHVRDRVVHFRYAFF